MDVTAAELDLLKKDFRNFLWYVWKHISLPNPTAVQYDIALYLQHGPQRMIIEGFRGMGKSFITSAFCCWCWLNDPELKIMVVSGSKERADAFSVFTKRLLADLPVLQHLDPHKGDGRVRNDAFDLAGVRNDHSPSLKSVGITGQLTGSRADIIIADDVETPKNSLTENMRERLETLVSEFEAILKPLPHTRIIYLGTPQTEESLYNKLVQKGYDLRVWPARVPQPDKLIQYGPYLAPYVQELIQGGAKAGDPVDPERFTDEELSKREAAYGRSGFALQFMLDTSLSDAERYPLRLSDLIVMDVNPEVAPVRVVWGSGQEQVVEGLPNVGFKGDRYHRPIMIDADWQPYEQVALFIDPSGRGADETAYSVLGKLGARLYLLAAGGMKGGYDEATLESLARIAKRYKVSMVVYESNFGDGMWGELFKPVLRKFHHCTVDEFRVSGQKEARIIDTLEPILNQHRLVVSKEIIQEDVKAGRENQLFYQLTHITRERGSLKHDDRIDALYLGVRYFTEVMDISDEEAIKMHEEEMWERELEEFYIHTTYDFGHEWPGGEDTSLFSDIVY